MITNFLPKRPLLYRRLRRLGGHGRRGRHSHRPHGARAGATGGGVAADRQTGPHNDGHLRLPPSCSATSDNFVWITGTAYSGGTTFKLVADYRLNPFSNGCFTQSGELSFTQQSGPARRDALWLTTTKSKICASVSPSLFIQTDSFTVRGGTGVFKDATGKATDWWSVLLYPQVANGEFLASVTY